MSVQTFAKNTLMCLRLQDPRKSKPKFAISNVTYKRVDILKDSLIIVRSDEVALAVRERIIVPHGIFKGLMISPHLKLDDPTTNQLKQVVPQYSFALDMDSSIEKVATCSALRPEKVLLFSVLLFSVFTQFH